MCNAMQKNEEIRTVSQPQVLNNKYQHIFTNAQTPEYKEAKYGQNKITNFKTQLSKLLLARLYLQV